MAKTVMHAQHQAATRERFTVSIPLWVLQSLDSELTLPGESRSAAVRRLIEEAARAARERADIARFVEGYREQPQTVEESGFSDQITVESGAGLPWQA
ncbi:MAG: hypothetical protein ACKVT1_00870 [Dehalococcoidia bacterium]